MVRVTVAFLACLMSAAVSEAGILVQGFEYRSLASTLPGGTNGAVCAAINPTTGDVWMGDGKTVYQLSGGSWGEAIGILAAGGGPLSNNSVTTSFTFDGNGNLFVNDWRDGNVYIRDSAGWRNYAHVGGTIRQMRFDTAGHLVVLSETGNAGSPGYAYSLDPLTGAPELIGALPHGAESFDFDATGALIVPHYFGTGIDRLQRDGTLTTLFTYPDVRSGDFESMAVTAGGNFLVGVNTFYSEVLERNTSQLIRINGQTGVKELIGVDVDFALPGMLLIDGSELLIAGYASLHPGQLSGDLDGPLVPLMSTPEPSTAVLGLVALGTFVACRRWRSKR